MSLLQLSGIVADLIYRVERIPAPGEEAIVHGFDIAAGGGFNAMAAAKRAGIDVIYAGGLGTGPFGQIAAHALDREGIETACRTDAARDQGNSVVLVDRDGERSFIASEGAEGYRTGADFANLPEARFTLLSGYVLHYPAARDAVSDWLRAAPRPGLVFDPSPVIAAIPPRYVEAAMARADWVSSNLAEAEVLTGESDPVRAAQMLAARRKGGVVRAGARGCWIANCKDVSHLPAYGGEVVDTTGAGDTHIGAFIAALARGENAFAAGRIANMAAALSIAHHGPATAPTLAETRAALSREDDQ